MILRRRILIVMWELKLISTSSLQKGLYWVFNKENHATNTTP